MLCRLHPHGVGEMSTESIRKWPQGRTALGFHGVGFRGVGFRSVGFHGVECVCY